MTHTSFKQTVVRLAAVLSIVIGCATPARAGDIEVTIYPILARLPIFGAEINVPQLPSLPPGPGGGDNGSEITGKSGTSLQSAYGGGLAIRADRWFGEAYGLWAAIKTEKSAPIFKLDTSTRAYAGKLGWNLGAGFAVTGGVRRFTTDLNTTLTLPGLDGTVEAKLDPGVWDPLIGVNWRGGFANRLIFDANFQGGGFGVGADVDLSSEAHLNMRIIKHLELRFGYSVLHFKISSNDIQIGNYVRKITVQQTLHGPEVGLGIVF